MSPTTLQRLREADPAASLPRFEPPSELLSTILAAPQTARTPPSPQRRRPRRLLVAGCAVVALALGAIVVSALPGPAGSPDLAARAYAATASDMRVLHMRTHMETVFVGPARNVPPGARESTGTKDYWRYGSLVHSLATFADAGDPRRVANDEVLGADGVLHSTISDKDGKVRARDTIRSSDGSEARGLIAQTLHDPVEIFRQQYKLGMVRDDGPRTFDGRRARGFIVTTTNYRGELFVDARSGRPLGIVSSVTIYEIRRPGVVAGVFRTTETIDTLEQLAPTSAVLARLHG